MKSRLLTLLALLALPAVASDNWQVGLGLNFQDSTNLSTAGMQFRHGAKFTPSLLAGYRLVEFGKNDLTVTGEYQFWSRYDLGSNRFGPVQGNLTYRREVIAPGMHWNHHQTPQLDWGLGLQMRFVNLKAANGVTTTDNAPWMDAHVRYTFQPVGAVKPFVAFRVARALSTHGAAPTAQDSTGAATVKAMRRLDGVWDASLQAGVRF
jgi:hypothetical protein